MLLQVKDKEIWLYPLEVARKEVHVLVPDVVKEVWTVNQTREEREILPTEETRDLEIEMILIPRVTDATLTGVAQLMKEGEEDSEYPMTISKEVATAGRALTSLQTAMLLIMQRSECVADHVEEAKWTENPKATRIRMEVARG